MRSDDSTHPARVLRHRNVLAELAGISDLALRDLILDAPALRSGIGGESTLLHIDDTPVFVKRIPLTETERRSENVMSTANIFDLPAYCHYGVGGPGFGVWREFSTHAITTNWVLTRQLDRFPLLHHWRVLDGLPPAPTPGEHLDIDATAAFWRSPTVSDRLAAVAGATASVVLFLEYVPHRLDQWLDAQIDLGNETLDSAIAMVHRELITYVPTMNRRGLFHFDAHFGNILTDGRRLVFTDFGLAASPRFDLSADESTFVGLNHTHDSCHTLTRLVDWIVGRLVPGIDDVESRNEYIRRCAEGRHVDELSGSAATVLRRYAPVAQVINEFYWTLHTEDPTVPYPTVQIDRALDAAGIGPDMRPATEVR